MVWYCNKCKRLHQENELCPSIRMQMANDPSLLAGAANLAAVAGTYALTTSQALDAPAKLINSLVGTDLSFEGTHQMLRDVQVFKRLNTEAFSRSGVFSTPSTAKVYLEDVTEVSKKVPRAMAALDSKLAGSAQEVDWLRMKQGEISSLWQKGTLLNKNAPGIDGVTVNRFNGKTISRTTIKATQSTDNARQTAVNLRQNTEKVSEAIEKGYATAKDTIFGPKGTKEAAESLGLNNPVVEKNTPESIRASNERLKQKIASGQATTAITGQQAARAAAQGAVIGAAVSLTISGITNYVRYRNGELSREEAFREASEDTMKGALVGGAMSAITLFLPGGAVGFAAGMAISIYISTACGNVLDEIYGKGAYGAILDAAGYVCGTVVNLADCVRQVGAHTAAARRDFQAAKGIQAETKRLFDTFDDIMTEVEI